MSGSGREPGDGKEEKKESKEKKPSVGGVLSGVRKYIPRRELLLDIDGTFVIRGKINEVLAQNLIAANVSVTLFTTMDPQIVLTDITSMGGMGASSGFDPAATYAVTRPGIIKYLEIKKVPLDIVITSDFALREIIKRNKHEAKYLQRAGYAFLEQGYPPDFRADQEDFEFASPEVRRQFPALLAEGAYQFVRNAIEKARPSEAKAIIEFFNFPEPIIDYDPVSKKMRSKVLEKDLAEILAFDPRKPTRLDNLMSFLKDERIKDPDENLIPSSFSSPTQKAEFKEFLKQLKTEYQVFNNKGDMAEVVFERDKDIPTSYLFLDDLKKNLDAVQAVFARKHGGSKMNTMTAYAVGDRIETGLTSFVDFNRVFRQQIVDGLLIGIQSVRELLEADKIKNAKSLKVLDEIFSAIKSMNANDLAKFLRDKSLEADKPTNEISAVVRELLTEMHTEVQNLVSLERCAVKEFRSQLSSCLNKKEFKDFYESFSSYCKIVPDSMDINSINQRLPIFGALLSMEEDYKSTNQSTGVIGAIGAVFRDTSNEKKIKTFISTAQAKLMEGIDELQKYLHQNLIEFAKSHKISPPDMVGVINYLNKKEGHHFARQQTFLLQHVNKVLEAPSLPTLNSIERYQKMSAYLKDPATELKPAPSSSSSSSSSPGKR